MFAPATNLRQSSRLQALPRYDERMSALEIVVLFGCGAFAAIAVCTLHISFRLPGHAVLRAVLPMAGGFAIVPRYSAGLIMAAAALVTTIALRLGDFGEIQSAGLVSLIALGPLMDLAAAGAPLGRKLYLRFIAAGAAANLVAFAVRYALASLISHGAGGGGGNGMGGRLGGGREFLAFWPVALLSFVLCGAVAGLVSSALWFRLRTGD